MSHEAGVQQLFMSLDMLRARIHSAMRAWEKVTSNTADLLDDLLLFKEAARTNASLSSASMPRLTTNYILTNALDQLELQNAPYAQLLHLRFVKGNTLGQTSDLMGLTIDQVRHNQRQAMEELTTIVANQEEERRRGHIHQVESQLPPSTYSELFGTDEAQRILIEQLLGDDTAYVVAITGIGGIGKTALADAVTRKVIAEFRFIEYVWLRADPFSLDRDTLDYETAIDLFAEEIARKIAPEVAGNVPKEARMVRVRQVLKEAPHLIIIDNLETISNTAFLMRQLQDWAYPSKFLLTTRIRPTGEASVFSYGMEELNVSESAELMRNYAEAIGQRDLAIATDEQAKMVYDAVGGNPLAIKLVVGLATTMPITLVLDDITLGHTHQIEDMYERVYRRTWQALTNTQRNLLRAMPLVAESGGTVAQLRKISDFDDANLWPAINELVNRSLLELLGTTWDRRYGIHRLTASFLQTNVNRWEMEEDEEDEELVL